VKTYLVLAIPFYFFTHIALADMNSANQALKEGDFTKAVEEFKKIAEQGEVKAQSHLGYMYYVGEGVPQNYAEAVKWYRKAAAQGDKDAQYNLAVCYAFGEGTKQDYKEAAIWYRRAAEQGHVISQYSLGISYTYGEGVEQDEKQAAEWFLKSAEQGYERAQVLLGSMFHMGDGIPKNYEKAVYWYRKAADRGNAAAQYNLGTLYRAGKGVPQDYNQAIRWFRLSADQGYAAAQNELQSMERAIAGAKREHSKPDAESDNETVSTTTQEPVTAAKTTPPVEKSAKSKTPLVTLQKDTLLNLETTEEKTEEEITEHTPAQATVVKKEPAIEEPETTVAEESKEDKPGFFSRLFGTGSDEKTQEALAKEEAIATAYKDLATPYQPKEVEVTEQESQSETPSDEEEVAEESTIERSPAGITTPSNAITNLWGRPSIKQPKIEDTEVATVSKTEAKEKPVVEIKKIETPYIPLENPPQVEEQIVEKKEPVEIKEIETPYIPLPTEPIADDTNEETIDTAEEKSESGGVFGFFSKLFSNDDDQVEDKSIKVETAIVSEDPLPPAVEEPVVKSYAEGEAPAEHQFSTVKEDSIAMLDEDLQTQPEPERLDTTSWNKQLIEPEEESVEEEVQTSQTTETSVAEDEDPEDLFNLFGGLFANDKEEQITEQTDVVAEETTLVEDEPVVQAMVETQPEVTVDREAEKVLETETQLDTNKTIGPDSKFSDISFETLQSMAVKGDIDAQNELGKLYYAGKGIKQNYSLAFLWYRRAAQQGNIEAQYSLGNMYLMGEGISQNDTEAMNWYTQAAEQGHTAAQHNLENLQRVVITTTADSGLAGNNEDDAENAAEDNQGFFSKFFSSDDKKDEPVEQVANIATVEQVSTNEEIEESPLTTAESDYKLGISYSYGENVAQNHEIAFQYFKKSAELGYAPAQYKLGVAYAYGEGIDQDIEQATVWYKKSAEQGYTIAQRSLGNMYTNGAGIEQNKPLGLAWYSILAEQGNVMDVHRRDALEKELTEPEIEEAERLKQQLSSNIRTASSSS